MMARGNPLAMPVIRVSRSCRFSMEWPSVSAWMRSRDWSWVSRSNSIASSFHQSWVRRSGVSSVAPRMMNCSASGPRMSMSVALSRCRLSMINRGGFSVAVD